MFNTYNRMPEKGYVENVSTNKHAASTSHVVDCSWLVVANTATPSCQKSKMCLQIHPYIFTSWMGLYKPSYTDDLPRCISINFSHHISLSTVNINNPLNLEYGSTKTLHARSWRACIFISLLAQSYGLIFYRQIPSKVQNRHVLMT